MFDFDDIRYSLNQFELMVVLMTNSISLLITQLINSIFLDLKFTIIQSIITSSII